jgi:hypothetical protein
LAIWGDLLIKPLLLVLEFPLVSEIERVIGNSLAQLFGLDGQIWHGLELLLPASKYTYCSVSSSAALAYNSSFRPPLTLLKSACLIIDLLLGQELDGFCK